MRPYRRTGLDLFVGVSALIYGGAMLLGWLFAMTRIEDRSGLWEVASSFAAITAIGAALVIGRRWAVALSSLMITTFGVAYLVVSHNGAALPPFAIAALLLARAAGLFQGRK